MVTILRYSINRYTGKVFDHLSYVHALNNSYTYIVEFMELW